MTKRKASKRKAPQSPPPERAPMVLAHLDPKVVQWPSSRITAYYTDGEEEVLARSLQVMGQQQPIIVTKVGETYLGTDGLHRCQEAIRRGDQTIPCVVREGGVRDVLLGNFTLATVHGRAKASEIVEVLGELRDTHGMKPSEIEEATGLQRNRVNDYLAIAGATEPVRQALDEDWLSLGHAIALARIEDRALQERMCADQLLHGRSWSVEKLAEEISKAQGQPGGGAEGASPPVGPGPLAKCAICDRVQAETHVRRLVVCFECTKEYVKVLEANKAKTPS